MKIRVIVLLLCFGAIRVEAQADVISDSLLFEMCKTLQQSHGVVDSIRLDTVYKRHLYPVLVQQPEPLRQPTFDYVYFRLQKLCKEYLDIIVRETPPQGDFERMDKPPASLLTKSRCRDFTKHKRYYYLEENGDTSQFTLKNNLWVDSLSQGMYSKLHFAWVNDCEFELTFIESNQPMRRSASKPGEKYRYRLVAKHDGYYEVFMAVKEANVMGTFRIYYQ